MENKLPESWVECQFGDIAYIHNGYAFKTSDFRRDQGIPLIKQSQLAGDKVDLTNCVFLDEVFLESKKDFIIKKGDVLIGMSGSVGKLCVYDLDSPALQNQRTGKVVPIGKQLDNRFFWYFLSTIEQALLDKGKGMGVTNVSADDIEDLPFYLPPLAEQQRIVAKLDAVFEKIESNKKRLEKIPVILKRFRQSVLAAAVSGRLTEDWRKENHFEIKFDISEEYEINETYREQYEIPSQWQWVALGNYVKCNRGRFSIRPRNDPRYFGGKIPFIQIGDLPREGGFVTSHTQTLNDLGLKVSKMFPKNTIAIAIVGATIANTGILAYDMCFTDSMVGMNKGDLDLNLFLDYYLRIEKENFRQLSYAGGGQPNIKLELLNAYPFPLPSQEEQKEIVRRVEQLFALADKLESRYKKSKAMLDKVPQSILAKAFRGELVSQNPDDEPASVLLERIKTEKEKLKAVKNTRKKK